MIGMGAGLAWLNAGGEAAAVLSRVFSRGVWVTLPTIACALSFTDTSVHRPGATVPETHERLQLHRKRLRQLS